MEDYTNIIAPEYEDNEVKFSETEIMNFENGVTPKANGFSLENRVNNEQMYEQQNSYTCNLETESVMIKEEVDYAQFSSDEDVDGHINSEEHVDPLFNTDKLNNVQFGSDEDDDTQVNSEEDVKEDEQKNGFDGELCSKVGLTRIELKRYRMWHRKLPNEKQCKLLLSMNTLKHIFNDKENQNNQIKTIKTHTRTKDYECEECHKKFVTKANLINHMVIHSEERPFKCDFCDATFKTNLRMMRHKYIHTGIHECNDCHKKYGTAYALMLHTRKHAAKSIIKCEFCDRTYKKKSSLNFHNRTCTKEKPQTMRTKIRTFICELCQKTFGRLYDLSTHKKRVHIHEKAYKCCECPKSFATRSSAKQHIINIHKNIDITTVIIDKFKTHFVEPAALVSTKVEQE